MNEFSILCRVLGTLYYRQPQDPLLVPLFTMIREGKLAQNWPLEQDDLLERLQKSCDMQQISDDYNALFVGEECRVSPYRSAWQEGATEAEVRAFLSERGMPLTDMPADHIGTLLLAASWIEDHASDDENEAIEKPSSKSICCPGVALSSGKLKHMRSHHSGEPWLHSPAMLSPQCGMS